MTATNAPSSHPRQTGRVRPILFALGLRPDWGLYMPHLLRLARETNSGIHVLETGAPLGTGTFSSNAVMNTTQPIVPTEAEVLGSPDPVLRRAEPGQTPAEPITKTPGDLNTGDPVTALAGEPWTAPPVSVATNAQQTDPHPSHLEPQRATSAAPQPDDPTLAWPDTVTATAQMNEFVESLVRYFQAAGVQASGDWQPDFDRVLLGEYARRIGASIIAVPRRGFPANLLQNLYIHKLEQDGFRVVLLEEISQQELDALKAHTETRTKEKWK